MKKFVVFIISIIIVFFSYKAVNLKTISNNKKTVSLIPYSFEQNIIYLAPDSTNKANIKKYICNNYDEYITYESDNLDIVTINKSGIITAHKNGITKIHATINNYKINTTVIVTSLITKMPTSFDYEKSELSCHLYTNDQNKVLDNILNERIYSAGYKTRAAVVAAARFLTLEFPYKINYYTENGRLSDTGLSIADGEGRYYHKGLFLSDNKLDDISEIYYGPNIWGCPIYSYISDEILPNGLNCSGFVTWALFNAGFDIGDIGAGPFDEDIDLTDYGLKTDITNDIINIDYIKVGDLIGYDGHIGIIVGIDEDNIYVAEALWEEFNALVVTKYKKDRLNKIFEYVMLMDSYYLENGNYTDMWY